MLSRPNTLAQDAVLVLLDLDRNNQESHSYSRKTDRFSGSRFIEHCSANREKNKRETCTSIVQGVSLKRTCHCIV